MKTHILNIAKGQAGVHRVVSELIARGHAPYLPVVDTGVDILLGGGVRLQIKTTQRPTSHWRTPGSWLFTLAASQRIVKRQYVKGAPRKFSEQVDFVILHAVEGNRFWIVPAHVLDGRNTVSFKDGSKQWKALDEASIKLLQAEGYTIAAIAEKFGVSFRTVTRRLTTFKAPKRNFANMEQYENRWDLITGALATLHEANEIAGVSRATVNADAVKA